MAYILSLDQGTTSSRSILFGKDGNILAQGQREFNQIYPQGGWVEHDPFDILTSQMSSVVEVLGKAGIRARDLAAVGITNQRETTIVWDRQTGKPVYNAIVWQDRRTAERCAQMKADGIEDTVRRKTGLLIDPYFSSSKIAWILENVEGARQKADSGKLVANWPSGLSTAG
jgi:glycerol kinase